MFARERASRTTQPLAFPYFLDDNIVHCTTNRHFTYLLNTRVEVPLNSVVQILE